MSEMILYYIHSCFSYLSKRKRASGMNTLGRLHWGSWMEPLRTSAKWNVESGGGPWCVVAQSWAAAPKNHEDM